VRRAKGEDPGRTQSENAAIAHVVALLEKPEQSEEAAKKKPSSYFAVASIRARKMAREGSSRFTDRSGCHCTASTKCSGAVPSKASMMPSSGQRAEMRSPPPILSAD